MKNKDIKKTNDSGITSLAGFAYQIRVFVYYMTQMSDIDSRIEFETLEDVVVSKSSETNIALDQKSDYFRSLFVDKNTYTAIQVKRTSLSNDTYKKILFNWLLLESSDKKINEYILFTEDSYGNVDELFSILPQDLFSEISNTTKKRSDALIVKVKDTYDGNFTTFKKDFENIKSRYIFISEEDLDDLILKGFSIHFRKSGVNDSIYKLRVKEFVQNITADIIRTIDGKRPYTCDFSSMMVKIEDISSRIKDDRYEPDFSIFKRVRKINLTDSFIAESREYKQLTKCKLSEKRIIDHLVFKQYYESIRYKYMEDNKLNFIDNIEETTFENFCAVKESFGPFKEDSPLNRLNSLKDKDNSYTRNDQTRFGSCIYLTKDAISEELKISWEDEDE